MQTDSSISFSHGVITQCAAPARTLSSPIAAPHWGETLIHPPKSSSTCSEPLSFLCQASRPDAFPHPHRLPAEGSRLGTNRPCSQVSASPHIGTLWPVTRAERTLCQQSILPPPPEKLRHMSSSRIGSTSSDSSSSIFLLMS